LAYFAKPIDVTPFSKLRCRYSASGYDMWFGLAGSPSSPGIGEDTYGSGYTAYYNDPNGKNVWVSGEVELDISNLTGTQYFAFGALGSGSSNYTGYFRLQYLEFIL
jgi:hypothetical protein